MSPLADIPDLTRQLGTVKHFRGLGLADLTVIVTSGQVARYARGAVICAEGEPCAGMFVLISGQVHLSKMGPQGQHNILSVIEPVIMFNEVAVLDGGPNPLTATAAQASLVWQISHDSFQSLLQRYPLVGLSLLKVLATRNRRLLEHYEDLSTRSVAARCAKLLLDLSEHGKLAIDRRAHPARELAGRISTVPELISRCLAAFRDQGLITVTRSEIIVREIDALAEQAQLSL